MQRRSESPTVRIDRPGRGQRIMHRSKFLSAGAPAMGSIGAIVGGTGRFDAAGGEVCYAPGSDGSAVIQISLRTKDK